MRVGGRLFQKACEHATQPLLSVHVSPFDIHANKSIAVCPQPLFRENADSCPFQPHESGSRQELRRSLVELTAELLAPCRLARNRLRNIHLLDQTQMRTIRCESLGDSGRAVQIPCLIVRLHAAQAALRELAVPVSTSENIVRYHYGMHTMRTRMRLRWEFPCRLRHIHCRYGAHDRSAR